MKIRIVAGSVNTIIHLTINNKILKTAKHPGGTGICVKKYHSIISQMEGCCDVNIDNNYYLNFANCVIIVLIHHIACVSNYRCF